MHFLVTLLLVSAPTAPIVIVTGAPPSRMEPAEPKKICRAGATTGTRVNSKICKTQAEWEAQASNHFNKSDAFANNGRSGY